MIFVTVGTELPFDRLVRTVDDWARVHGRTDVFAQIGRTRWRPSFIAFAEFLPPAEFNRRFVEATCVISHAGMGTILSALRFEKPLLVMPRRAELREHRNDHQLSTVSRLRDVAKFAAAMDEQELRSALDHIETLAAPGGAGAFAQSELITAIADFIHLGRLHDEPQREANGRPPAPSLAPAAPPSRVAG